MKWLLLFVFIVTFAEAQFSNDAIVLTLRTQESIWLDTALASRIDSGLSAARRVRDTLNSISVFGDYVLGELLVETNATWSQSWANGNIQTGELYIDSLAEEFSLQSVYEEYPPWHLFMLTFSPYLNMPKLAELYERHRDILFAEINGYGGDGDNIELMIMDNVLNFAFSHGEGDCPSGCIDRYYWYVSVEENVATLEEEKYLSSTPYLYRWNIPPVYDMTFFPDGDSILSAVLFESEWWVRRHAIEGIRLFFETTSPWSSADSYNQTYWNELRTSLFARRQLVVEVLQAAMDDDDALVRESALKAYESISGFIFNRNHIDFNEVRIGTSKSDSIQLINTGEDTLMVSSVTANISGISINPQNVTISPGGSCDFTVTYSPDTALRIKGNIFFAHNRFDTPTTVRVSGWGITQVSYSMELHHGWNLISLPVRPNDYQKSVLFPTANSSAYFYQENYIMKETLTAGKGFWLRFDSSQTISLDGWQCFSETVDVVAGWNIVGTILSPLLVSNIKSLPANMTTSAFYAFNGKRYVQADTLEPGKAYWMKVEENGELILSPSVLGLLTKINIVSQNELPPFPPERENQNMDSKTPSAFSLEQNYPNPFNPSTNFGFRIANFGLVTLKVYDVLGREVAILVDEKKDAGEYSVRWDADRLPSGVYYYKLQAGEFSSVKKLLLMR